MELSFTDYIFGCLFEPVFPWKKFGEESKHVSDYKMPSKFLLRMRKRYKVFIGVIEWICLNLWSLHTRYFSESGGYLVRGSVTVDRFHHILSEWKVLSKLDLDDENTPFDMSESVEITLTCPSRCIKGNINIHPCNGLFSFYQVFDSCHLDDIHFQPTVPIIVWFHGGGMVIGNSCDEGILMPYLLSKTSRKDLIWLSVNYRLAPENPFPAAIIDGLSVLTNIIDKYPKNTIHVAGLSAGGNLSTVIGFETFRKFPRAVDCIVSLDPMLDPTVSSPSSKLYGDSPICPNEFLRYCWGVYLKLGSFKDQDGYETALKNALSESEGKLRLIRPSTKLPNVIESEGNPCILVKTSSSDTLRDDGVQLIQGLQELGANVHVYETQGSHEISLLFDWRVLFSMLRVWSSLLWHRE